MKVSDVNLSMRDLPAQTPVERPALGEPVRSFRRELTELNADTFRTHVEDLVNAINRQGEIVAKRADIKELHKYREMITQLINETVSNNYVFTKNSAFDARGRHRVYSMIKKINTNLDDMTQELLKEQTDNLELLDRVDDIRGLLVDMFL